MALSSPSWPPLHAPDPSTIPLPPPPHHPPCMEPGGPADESSSNANMAQQRVYNTVGCFLQDEYHITIPLGYLGGLSPAAQLLCKVCLTACLHQDLGNCSPVHELL